MGTFGCVRYPTKCVHVSFSCEYDVTQQRHLTAWTTFVSALYFTFVLILYSSDMKMARWETCTSTLRKPGSAVKFYKWSLQSLEKHLTRISTQWAVYNFPTFSKVSKLLCDRSLTTDHWSLPLLNPVKRLFFPYSVALMWLKMTKLYFISCVCLPFCSWNTVWHDLICVPPVSYLYCKHTFSKSFITTHFWNKVLHYLVILSPGHLHTVLYCFLCVLNVFFHKMGVLAIKTVDLLITHICQNDFLLLQYKKLDFQNVGVDVSLYNMTSREKPHLTTTLHTRLGVRFDSGSV